jgi:hypothetical protein
MVMTQEDNALTGGEMLFAYSNPEKMSVSVSVSQDYIAQLYVGEEATVIIDEYGQYTATVQTINPVSSSDNRTSVSYTVTLLLDTEDISDLSANLTATVIFGSIEIPQDINNNQPDMSGQPDMENQPNMGDQSDMENQPDMDNNQLNQETPQGKDDQPNMEQQPDMNNTPQGGKHEEKENN